MNDLNQNVDSELCCLIGYKIQQQLILYSIDELKEYEAEGYKNEYP